VRNLVSRRSHQVTTAYFVAALCIIFPRRELWGLGSEVVVVGVVAAWVISRRELNRQPDRLE
jgi:hypothetical protein